VLFEDLPAEQVVVPDTGRDAGGGGDVGEDAGGDADGGLPDAADVGADADGGGGDAGTLQGPSAIGLIVGVAEVVDAVVVDASGDVVVDAIITWSSDDEGVATVDEDGRVLGVGAGRAVVTATFGAQTLDVNVVVEEFDALRMDVGPSHACALDRATSRLLCWGAGSRGELGDGASRSSATPRFVDGTQRWVSVSVGRHFTCGITELMGAEPNITGGDVFCWGLNDKGQLGDGTKENRSAPVRIQVTGPFVKLDVGDAHACASRRVADGGGLFCWGNNDAGQIAAPLVLADVASPRRVTTGAEESYKDVSVSAHTTCAVSTTSSIYCWGEGSDGQLGNGANADSVAPVEAELPSAGTGADTVTVGDGFACAKTIGDQVYCWGRNDSGQLGTGDTTASNVPVEVDAGEDYAQISARADHVCGVIDGGSGVECWGAGTYGQLGDGSDEPNLSPAPVPGLGSGLAAVATSDRTTCASSSTGDVWCWGERGPGLLGDGAALVRALPETQGLGRVYEDVAVMRRAQCALSEGKVYCWGDDADSRLGQGTVNEARVEPGEVQGLEDVTVEAIDAGVSHACALSTEGEVYCWGAGEEGQLGDGERQTSSSAVKVALQQRATEIAVGALHTCAVGETGEVLCWGDGRSGELGDGNPPGSLVPVAADAGPTTRFVSVSAGDGFTCALSTTREVFCWGRGAGGRLGNGGTSDQLTPAKIDSGAVVFDVLGVGATQACALDEFGAMYCWGVDELGSFGDTAGSGVTTSPRPISLTVAPTLDEVDVGGLPFACGIREANLFCWGNGLAGQQGGGVFRTSLVPEQIELGAGVQTVSLGEDGACAVTDVGDVKCWGMLGAAYGFDGEVYGPGSRTARQVPFSQ
jgi:alpha-tubulin suppressor-like RCC1 family protein